MQLLDDTFSLLLRAWIPVQRASGARAFIRPAEVAFKIDDDPVIAFCWGRPDLDAATRELLIGLLATACSIEARDRWRAWLDNPPTPEVLDAAFAPLASAFLLDAAGPRFQQNFESLGGSEVAVSQLLIEAPGGKTIRDNLDHFVRRGGVQTLSRAAAAIVLHCLQTFAPSGGAGNRTSLRGGGPLTTLLTPGFATIGENVTKQDGVAAPLWRTLWLNVLPAAGEEGDPPEPLELPRIFSWLAPTRVSNQGLATTPQDVDPLQVYWGMPRRIRLDFEPNTEQRACDLTGIVDDVIVQTYRTRPHGTNYVGWGKRHPLSPYYRQNIGAEWLPLHGQPGRIGYRHWVGLIVSDSEELREPAAALVRARKRLEQRNMPASMRLGARLLASGYDMANMKARDFIESEVPLHLVREELFEGYGHTVEALVAGAREGAFILRMNVRQALYGSEAPSDGGKIADAREQFWDRTEPLFAEVLAPLARDLEASTDDTTRDIRQNTREKWLEHLQRTTETLFDELVSQTDFDIVDIKMLERRVEARRSLRTAMRGYGKFGNALFKALQIPLPEPEKTKKSDPDNARARSRQKEPKS